MRFSPPTSPVADAARFVLIGCTTFESAVPNGVVTFKRVFELVWIEFAGDEDVVLPEGCGVIPVVADDDESGLREVTAGAVIVVVLVVAAGIGIAGEADCATDDDVTDDVDASGLESDEVPAVEATSSNSLGIAPGVACTEVINFARLS